MTIGHRKDGKVFRLTVSGPVGVSDAGHRLIKGGMPPDCGFFFDTEREAKIAAQQWQKYVDSREQILKSHRTERGAQAVLHMRGF
jgi:hypothetical protein